jgi:hypothetical protein
MEVPHTCVIAAEARHSNIALSICEPLAPNWIRWKKEVDDGRPYDSQGTCKEEHVLPWLQAPTCDVTKTVVDKWSKHGNIAYMQHISIRDETRNSYVKQILISAYQ